MVLVQGQLAPKEPVNLPLGLSTCVISAELWRRGSKGRDLE
jgi:hypothetical protein